MAPTPIVTAHNNSQKEKFPCKGNGFISKKQIKIIKNAHLCFII